MPDISDLASLVSPTARAHAPRGEVRTLRFYLFLYRRLRRAEIGFWRIIDAHPRRCRRTENQEHWDREADAGAVTSGQAIDRQLEDIFDLQDQLTASVLGALVPQLEHAEIERAKRKPTESLDAYDYFLRGMASYYQRAHEAINEALRLCD
jgi:hypothetical protein